MNARPLLILSVLFFSLGMTAGVHAFGSRERTVDPLPPVPGSELPSKKSGTYGAPKAEGTRFDGSGRVAVYGGEMDSWIGFTPDGSSKTYAVLPAEAANDLRSVQDHAIFLSGVISENPASPRLPGTGDGSVSVASWKIID
jgi:hypothetical protein